MKPLLLLVLLSISNLLHAQDGTYTQLSYKCSDNTIRPFIVYTPKSIDKDSNKPLLVYLHGSISSPQLNKDPLAYIKKSKLIKLAEAGGFHLMFSFGQKGATWFDSVGMDMVMGEINEVKTNFNINEDKVFLSGFSDGGSGVLYFSMVNPMPFAGFIAMNGSLKVAEKLGRFQLFPANMNNKPTYVINTEADMLYPIKQMRSANEYLQTFNPNLVFRALKGNHEMSYLETEQGKLINFINNTARKPNKELSWECADVANNSMEWLTIKQLDSLVAPKPWHKPYAVKVLNDKADFGLNYDYEYDGKGLKVNGFKSDTCTAKKMGVLNDDIVLMMEQDTMKSAYSPYYYLAKKIAGDSTSLTVQRNDKIIELGGVFNKGFYYEIFDNKTKSGKAVAKIDGRQLYIKTSRVKEIAVHFDKLNDYGISEVILNGKKTKLKPKGQQVLIITE